MIMAYFENLSDEFDFGKYSGKSLSDVIDLNPSYINWCMMNVNNLFYITDEAMAELRIVYPHFLVSNDFEERRRLRIDEFEALLESDINGPSFCKLNGDDESVTYDRYNGSYAQDVANFSDEDIDTIFDGEPDAYWNID